MKFINIIIVVVFFCFTLPSYAVFKINKFYDSSEDSESGEKIYKIKIEEQDYPELETKNIEINSASINKKKIIYHKNGVVKYEIDLDENNMTGQVLEFRKTGELKKVYNYKAGKLDGELTEYQNDGKTLKRVIAYDNGLKHGLDKRYDKQGILQSFKKYEAGKRKLLAKENSLGAKVAKGALVTAALTGIFLLSSLNNNQNCRTNNRRVKKKKGKRRNKRSLK